MEVNEKRKLLVVSFDAVGSEELSLLDNRANIWKLKDKGSLFENTKSIFVSNTYPVHASVSTGRLPEEHGLISNTGLEPGEHSFWRWDSRQLKTKTIFEAAHDAGIDSAAIMWPVTGHAGSSIRYNFPEIMAGPGQSTIWEYLKAGQIAFNFGSFLRFKSKLSLKDPSMQPEKDDFATSVLEDLLARKVKQQPGLIMLHLTAYDDACHRFGKYSEQSKEALLTLDRNLGRILKVVEPDTEVIVFSDHCQLNYSSFCDPDKSTMNDFANHGHMRFFFYYCGGTCFCFPRLISERRLCDLKSFCLGLEGVQRLVTENEMASSGFLAAGAAFGLCAREGYVFDKAIVEKAEHGYSLDRNHYGTFILTSWKEDSICEDVRDVTRLAAQVLGLQYKRGII